MVAVRDARGGGTSGCGEGVTGTAGLVSVGGGVAVRVVIDAAVAG
jgi:hypothetical protein